MISSVNEIDDTEAAQISPPHEPIAEPPPNMAKRRREKRPIMSPDEERLMAFEGLLQWTQAVVRQSERIAPSYARGQTPWKESDFSSVEKRMATIAAMHEATLERHT